MSTIKHQLRLLISDNFTRNAVRFIKRGDLKHYSTDGKYIYKDISHDEYIRAVKNGDNEPWRMEELGLDCEYNFNFKK